MDSHNREEPSMTLTPRKPPPLRQELKPALHPVDWFVIVAATITLAMLLFLAVTL